MSIAIDLSGFTASLAQKQAAIQAAVRPAAQAGVQVIYDRARQLCPVSTEKHYFYGRQSKKTGVKYLFEPGNLREAIYQVFSQANSSVSKATYHVSWNHSKAPYGAMVERGTSRAAAHPFMRPAIVGSREAAQAAMRDEFVKRVNAA